MAAGSTYTPIATQTLASNQTTVTFSSISSAYTDLVLILQVAYPPSWVDTWLQFNGDTATNYSNTILSGNGTSATSIRASTQAYIALVSTGEASTLGASQIIVSINNYANATTNKTILSRAGTAGTASAGFGTDAVVGLWRSTAAVTSILLKPNGGYFATGSTLTLYGITAA